MFAAMVYRKYGDLVAESFKTVSSGDGETGSVSPQPSIE